MSWHMRPKAETLTKLVGKEFKSIKGLIEALGLPTGTGNTRASVLADIDEWLDVARIDGSRRVIVTAVKPEAPGAIKFGNAVKECTPLLANVLLHDLVEHGVEGEDEYGVVTVSLSRARVGWYKRLGLVNPEFGRKATEQKIVDDGSASEGDLLIFYDIAGGTTLNNILRNALNALKGKRLVDYRITYSVRKNDEAGDYEPADELGNLIRRCEREALIQLRDMLQEEVSELEPGKDRERLQRRIQVPRGKWSEPYVIHAGWGPKYYKLATAKLNAELIECGEGPVREYRKELLVIGNKADIEKALPEEDEDAREHLNEVACRDNKRHAEARFSPERYHGKVPAADLLAVQDYLRARLMSIRG